MLELKKYIKQNRWAYLFAILSMVASIILDMISPQLIRHIIDDVIIAKHIEILTYLLLGLIGVGVGRCIFQYTKEFTFDSIAAKIGSQLRRDLMAFIHTLSANFFDKNNTGELMSRVKDDIDKIWDAIGFISMLIIEIIIHITIVLYFMFSLNWKLSIIPTFSMIFAAFIAIKMHKILDEVYGDIAQEDSVLNNTAAENLEGVRTVKAFTREQYEIEKFKIHNLKFYDLNVKQSRVFVKFFPFLQFLSRLLPYLVILPGGYFVIKNELTLGELTAFVAYSSKIVWPMQMLGQLVNGMSAAIASGKRINKIYANKPQIIEPKNPIVLSKITGAIVFDDVSFKSEEGKKILSNISFNLKATQTLGIMGATGAGKSTIINLLTRMYDATNGKITVDNINIKKLSFKQLRQNIAVVAQDVFLFSDTVGENITLGRRETSTIEDINRAADAACASSFITKMDNGYNTVIGERGVGLSGGQKQRLTIARALSSNSPILVFDDSTSALDMETEAEIHHTLNSHKGMTKIIIGHRVSAVRYADEIIILKNGAIAERGTHEELIALNGLYAETYALQYGDKKCQ